jgi:hypothetical protein
VIRSVLPLAAQMIQFPGGASGFPIMSPSRNADSTAAWLTRHLGSAWPLTATAGTAAPAETAVRITEYALPCPPTSRTTSSSVATAR